MNDREKGRKPKTSDRRERLQKILQRAGIASRRAAEELITSGRVSVNGRVSRDLPCFADGSTDEIRVDGVKLGAPGRIYLALNKPKGYVCTTNDEEGRPIFDLVDRRFGLLHTIGRLDADSEGLIILTNDGEVTNFATHPRYGLRKCYEAFVRGRVGPEILGKLMRGVHLSDGRARCEDVRIVKGAGEDTILSIILAEGKNRQIRRMLAHFGVKVKRLKRVSIGPIKLGTLKSGQYRTLGGGEIGFLKELGKHPSKAAKLGNNED